MRKTLHRASPWVILGLILLFVTLVRVRLLDFPLERDEGEYAYMGQLVLEGVPPYTEAYNMKLPGTFLMYALIMKLFGQNIQGIHVGLLIINCAAILLIFLLGRKIFSQEAALVAACCYAVLSLDSSVVGFAAHATHFVVVPALCGTLLLLSAVKRGSLGAFLLSGVCFGLAVIMKQPGLFFLLFGFSYVLYMHFFSRPADSTGKLFRTLGSLALGGVLPVLFVVLWIYTSGSFEKFWFWTVDYAAGYGSQVPLSQAVPGLLRSFSFVAENFWAVWILAAMGIIVLLSGRTRNADKAFVGLFTFFSFLTVLPGFYYRSHYFITLLPAASLCVALFVDHLNDKSVTVSKAVSLKFIGYGAFTAAVLFGIGSQRDYFFREDPVMLSRQIYDPNPFADSMEIARFIQAGSSPSDRVAVFGSEPQIYFYSGRRAATGYIYTYGLMENHKYALAMQREMTREIEASDPKFIVDVHIQFSWLVRPTSEQYVFEWVESFLRNGYSLVGIVDIISPEMTVYRWYEQVKGYTVQSPSYLLIYERK